MHHSGVQTLFGLTEGKDMGQSIGSVSTWLLPVWMAFTLALIVAALKSFFFSVGTLIDTSLQMDRPIYSLWFV